MLSSYFVNHTPVILHPTLTGEARVVAENNDPPPAPPGTPPSSPDYGYTPYGGYTPSGGDTTYAGYTPYGSTGDGAPPVNDGGVGGDLAYQYGGYGNDGGYGSYDGGYGDYSGSSGSETMSDNRQALLALGFPKSAVSATLDVSIDMRGIVLPMATVFGSRSPAMASSSSLLRQSM